MRHQNVALSVLVVVGLPILTGYGLAWPVPDTGQTLCYDDAGNEITCPQPGEPFYGQDGNYTINSPSFTKLDTDGNALPNSATSWTMVRDNVTGLIWSVPQNKDEVPNYDAPCDADNTYTWYNSDPDTNGGDPGTPGDGTDTEDFITALNAANYGGYSNWRLPTIDELETIVDLSHMNPSINTSFFPDTKPSTYCSATPYADISTGVWCLHFYLGYDISGAKSKSSYVIAVCGEQVQHSFVESMNSTVTDTSTGLTWQQATAPGSYNWQQALAYCENLDLGEHTDWRLPTRKELRSLVDYGRYSPSIDATFFPDSQSIGYWTSTTYAADAENAWGMFFSYGFGGRSHKSGDFHVRAVRGGDAGSKVTSITLNGVTSLKENSSASYTVTATYKDGSSETITTGVIWSVDSHYASITIEGSLTALSVTSNQTVTISAEYDVVSASKAITILNEPPDIGYNVSNELWANAVLEVSGSPVALVWQEVGADRTPSGDQVISGYFYAEPADFPYGNRFNPELFLKIYISESGWCNIAFNHVTVDPVTVYSAHRYAGAADQTGSATLDSRLVEHTYSGVAIDSSKQSSEGSSGTAAAGGYDIGAALWSRAILQVSTSPVTPVNLLWRQVGADTTPSGARVVSGYFYAHPDDFTYGSPYNPEVFVKVYIDPTGWANLAFNHVTVDPVAIESAHQYAGTIPQSGIATVISRLLQHEYTGVSAQ